MLYVFILLLLLINIDQETILNWFGIEDSTVRQISSGQDLNFSNIETSTNLSINTVRLIIEGLWDNIQSGLNLADIETILFFILFVRFIILAIRYNIKTSFYITCIGLFAGYLWYRHLIDTIIRYKDVLTSLPLLSQLGNDAIKIATKQSQTNVTELKLEENTNWYNHNSGQLIYSSIIRGIIHIDPETGHKYYIDPISMIISKFQNSRNSTIISLYYKLYQTVIPKIFNICKNFWNQLSGVAAYAIITRIGKRYCPYLIRWHWTLLLIVSFVEGIVISFVERTNLFKIFLFTNSNVALNSNLQGQIQLLNLIINSVVLAHVGFLIFALFHAIWGQYFYVPFFVENTELHIGSRPINSIYSGGATAWQNREEREKKLNKILLKFWYGWFGKGTQDNGQLISNFQRLIKKVIKIFKKQFRR